MKTDNKNKVATIYDLLNFCMKHKYNYEDGDSCSNLCPMYAECIVRAPQLAVDADSINTFNRALLQQRYNDRVYAHTAALFCDEWFRNYPEGSREAILKYIARVNNKERISILLNRYYEDIFPDDTLDGIFLKCASEEATDTSVADNGLTEITW